MVHNLLTDCKYTMLCPPEIIVIGMNLTFALSVLAENIAVTFSNEVRGEKKKKRPDTTPPELPGLLKSSY